LKKIIIFAGPSGTGKTTIARFILGNFSNLSFSVSATTRPPRHGEVNGKDYYFLSPEEFTKRIELGDFIEYEEVYAGLYYGTMKQEISRIWAEGKIPVLDVDVNGALNIKNIYPENSKAIFVHPMTIQNLETRLIKRKTESEQTLKKRLERAEMELMKAEEFDEIIYNEDLETACNEALELVSEYLK